MKTRISMLLILLVPGCGDGAGGQCRYDIDCPDILVCDDNLCVPHQLGEPDGSIEPDGSTDPDDAPIIYPEPVRWRSHLYPMDWTPEFQDSAGRFIHDFSYAGYGRGERDIPDLQGAPVADVTDPAYGADPTGGTDSTAAIQAAIDDLGGSGGGIVYLPEGTYKVRPPAGAKHALCLCHDGVVLRGAGRDRTFLINTDTLMRGKNVIQVGLAERVSWYEAVGDTVPLAADGMNRAREIRVTDASPFAVGDWVVVRSQATPEFIAEHGMSGQWTSGAGGPVFLRQITAIQDDRIEIDIPLRYPVLLRDSAVIHHVVPHVREVGIEDLSIGMLQHPGNSGWGDQDYTISGTPAYEVHYCFAIRFANVINGWVQRVNSFRPPGNTDMVHLLSKGIALVFSRNVTVRQCVMQHPQYEGGGGNGNGYSFQGSDNLMEDCAAVSMRHASTFTTMKTSGNVNRRFASVAPRFASDFHCFLSMANLGEEFILSGDYIDATYRPWGTVTHGHTTTQSTIWNTMGLAYPSDYSCIVDSRQYDWGLVIGTQGPAMKICTTPLVDSRDTSPRDWHEGEGAGGTLAPRSLYRDQLYRRLHDGAAPPPTQALLNIPTLEESFVRDGRYANTNYSDSDALEVKDSIQDWTRRAFLKFDLSSCPNRIHQAVLVVYARVSDQGGNRAVTSVYGVNDDSWSESTITWNNQPSLGPYLSKLRIDDSAEWRPLDVTSHVRAALQGDGIVSLALSQSLGDEGLLVKMPNSDSSEHAPYLEIVPQTETVLPVVSIDASPAHSETDAEYTVDGDLTTRWSNNQYGGQITYDLGAVKTVAGVGIAFYNGNQRIAFFEVQVSQDGVVFTPVLGAKSAGNTNMIQPFLFTERQARFVRIVGFGSSQNSWNSYTEVEVYAPPFTL